MMGMSSRCVHAFPRVVNVKFSMVCFGWDGRCGHFIGIVVLCTFGFARIKIGSRQTLQVHHSLVGMMHCKSMKQD